jgi:PRTRC genetic system protein A
MKVIAPYMSCLLESSDETIDGVTPLDRAIAEGYSQIFITAKNGIFKYHILTPGANNKSRYVCLPVDEVPGITLPKVEPGVNFLPDGKIPMKIFDEVKEFFRQVIVKKGQKLEAMIWVLWNPTDGYHLHVPNQTVGHASANYDWASLPLGSVIVVDIHSHADFGAFFSGTDDRDDTDCIRYSGVIGHNDKTERTMKFRFTYFGRRMDVELKDLFEHKEVAPEIPGDWLDKVKTQTYGPYHGQIWQGGGYTPQNFRGGQYNVHNNGSTPPNPLGSKTFTGMSGPIHGVQRSLSHVVDVGTDSALNAENESAPGGAASKKSIKREMRRQAHLLKQEKRKSKDHRQDQHIPMLESSKARGTEGVSSESRFRRQDTGVAEVGNGPLTLEEMDELFQGIPDVGIRDAAKEIIKRSFGTIPPVNDEEAELTRQAEEYMDAMENKYKPVTSAATSEEEMEEFDSIAINHGVEVARAYQAVDLASPVLANTPELISRSIGSMFEYIPEDQRLGLFRQLADQLPDKAKDDLAMYGL